MNKLFYTEEEILQYIVAQLERINSIIDGNGEPVVDPTLTLRDNLVYTALYEKFEKLDGLTLDSSDMNKLVRDIHNNFTLCNLLGIDITKPIQEFKNIEAVFKLLEGYGTITQVFVNLVKEAQQ
jgi:hypothetical protein